MCVETLAGWRCRRRRYALPNLSPAGRTHPRLKCLSYAFVPPDKARYAQAVSVTHPILPIEIQATRYRPMILEDIPRVHEIDQLSFSLPWPEKSFRFELTENPTTIALGVAIVPINPAGLVIGMSVVWLIVDEAHIATIAI